MAQPMRYDNQVVVITGAGAGLGRQYALFFASRGAKVVVNDLGGSFNGKDTNTNTNNTHQPSGRVADSVVQEIHNAGGVAVANHDAVQHGERIVETAIKAFGRIDVLINNAGILRDVTLKNMTDDDWDAIMAVHVSGAMRVTRAAWPHMRKQRYGRVIFTSSSSGLFGNFGQANYAAAKMALVGLGFTLALEGRRYGIGVNVIAPGAATRLTRTVWSEEIMSAMGPEWVVPLVGVLCHGSCGVNGGIFEAAAGHFGMIRWERSRGWIGRVGDDGGLTADVVLRDHGKIVDFEGAEHPVRVADSMALLERARTVSPSQPGEPLVFRDRVVLVTGAGDGLGRAYARHFAGLGAKVVVNDVKNAAKVADEIIASGGEATACEISVVDGAAVVKAVVERYKRIDVVVNNAGILRDKVGLRFTWSGETR
jgi:multifunctional beta-oxidation protein